MIFVFASNSTMLPPCTWSFLCIIVISSLGKKKKERKTSKSRFPTTFGKKLKKSRPIFSDFYGKVMLKITLKYHGNIFSVAFS